MKKGIYEKKYINPKSSGGENYGKHDFTDYEKQIWKIMRAFHKKNSIVSSPNRHV